MGIFDWRAQSLWWPANWKRERELYSRVPLAVPVSRRRFPTFKKQLLDKTVFPERPLSRLSITTRDCPIFAEDKYRWRCPVSQKVTLFIFATFCKGGAQRKLFGSVKPCERESSTIHFELKFQRAQLLLSRHSVRFSQRCSSTSFWGEGRGE